MSLEQFWSLSLRELWNVRSAHTAQARNRADRDVSLAWYGEAFARTKTLPQLNTLLSSRKAKQTPDEQIDALMQLSDLYNIPIVRIPASQR